MIPNEKFVAIAKGLLEKTKQKKAGWNAPPAGGSPIVASRSTAGAPTDFHFRLPNSTVILGFHSPSVGNDFVSLTIFDSRGNTAGIWKVEEGQDDWPLASELYQEVSKQVNKWDKVLEEVEKFIGQPS